MLGHLGDAPAALTTIFTSRWALEAGLPGKLSGRRRFQAVSRTRGLKRSDMVRNGATPRITVPPRGGPVLIDGRAARLEPATWVPLGQFYHIA